MWRPSALQKTLGKKILFSGGQKTLEKGETPVIKETILAKKGLIRAYGKKGAGLCGTGKNEDRRTGKEKH